MLILDVLVKLILQWWYIFRWTSTGAWGM